MPMLRPFLSLLLAALAALALPAQVTAYHGVSSATHQTQFNQLSGQGYRLVSLSVAGTLQAPTYSAVWDLASGPSWVASHDMTYQQYWAQRSTWIGQGYRPKIVSVGGTNTTDRVYAAVFVADGLTDVIDDPWMSLSQFEAAMAGASNPPTTTPPTPQRIPVSVDIVGDAANGYHYSVVLEPNPNGIVWGYDIDADTTAWTETRLAHGEGTERLAALGMSEDQRFVSVWYDQSVGTETVTGSLSAISWGITFSAQTGNGLWPRVIASGGSGSAQRFSGSFAFYRQPLPRQAVTTGVYRPQFAAFDTYMTNLLQTNRARAGAMAIARDGKLVYARGFTRAEAGFPITQPTSVFRIGSVSKVLNAVATHEADEQDIVAMTDKPRNILNLTWGSSWFANIELSHIFDYTTGCVGSYTAENVAAWPNPQSPTFPATLTQAAGWLASQNSLFQPGSAYLYSNPSFVLSAEVLRVRTGMPYVSWLQQSVLSPLGITGIRIAPSEYAQLAADDVRHQLKKLVLSESELYQNRPRRSAQFAEDLNLKHASGGMASSAVDYVRFLAGVFDLRGADAIVLGTPTVQNILARRTYTEHSSTSQKNACLAAMSWKQLQNGVYSYRKTGELLTNANAVSVWRDDHVSWVVFINCTDAGIDDDVVNNLIDGVTTWPNVDEFPNYGLPAFPQRARIDTVLPSVQNNVTSSFFSLTGRRFDTVTAVNFGGTVITSQSPTNWAGGYFVVNSPTSMWIYPPQGRQAGSYAISLVNSVGTSLPQNVTLQNNSSFQMAAPTVVNPGQPWSVYIARGTSSGLTQAGGFGILVLSFSNQPSVVPGFVSLGLGNQFTDYVTSDAFQFSIFTNIRRFDLPPLPSGTVYLETIGFDVTAPSLFPLLTTNTTSTTRL